MDEIQKILIKAGRKDLAQKYFLKLNYNKQSGTWALPDVTRKIKDLSDILKNIKRDGLDKRKLYNTFGDDELFDNVDKSLDDIKTAIKNRLSKIIKQYVKNPDEFPEIVLDVRELKKLLAL